jgi:hypothetical protein
LLGVLPAVALGLSWKPLELSSSMRFASVGMNWQYSISDSIVRSEPPHWSHFEPFVEAGIMVTPRIAVGGWLTTVEALPKEGSVFTHTPMPSFGIAAGYLIPVGRWFRAFANARAGLTSLSQTFFERRVGISGGALAGNLGPVGVGLEIGGLWDMITLPAGENGADRTLVSRTLSVGLKVQGYSR